MKVLTTIFFLFCFFNNAFAQGNGSDKVDTTKYYGIRDYFPPRYPNFPLVILNGKRYDGKLAKLNVRIKNIQIFKGQGTSAIFGTSSDYGIIIISSTNNKSFYNFPKPIKDTAFNGPIVYINDGILSATNNKSQMDLLERDVITDNKLKGIHMKKIDSIIINTSKQYAIMEYQNKFCSFSEEYCNYVERDKNGDNEIVYVLNGDVLSKKDSNDLFKKLYDIPISKIKSLTFMKKYYKEILNNDKPVVLITTK